MRTLVNGNERDILYQKGISKMKTIEILWRSATAMTLIASAAFGCSSNTHDAAMHDGLGTDAGHGGDSGHGGKSIDEGGAGMGTPIDSGVLPSTTPLAAITYDALFVVNGGDNSVSVVNANTNEIAGTIALKNAIYPHHLYMSRDRSKLVLAVPGMDLSMGHSGHGGPGAMGAVLVLDATTGATLKARRLDAMNHNGVFSPDGSEIWTSQITTMGSVLVLDAASLETKKKFDVGDAPAEITFAADGSNAFVANSASQSVSIVNPMTKVVTKTISVGKGPVGAWQGSNSVAYVDNEEAKTISAIDTKTLAIKLTYNLGFTPGMVALGPDGNVWVTDAENGKIVLFMEAIDRKHHEIVTAAGAHAIAFSGDGKVAYVSNQLANSVSVIDVTTKRVTKTLNVGMKPNGLVWRAK
jgi:YVTN family beta-propeller protein